MLPFASGVNRFFRFREISFRLRFPNCFLSSRGAFMLHPAPQVNHYFAFWLNRPAQCVIPVTREKQFKQTPHLCQHKKQILLSGARKCPTGAIFAQPVPALTMYYFLLYLIHAPAPSCALPKQGG